MSKTIRLKKRPKLHPKYIKKIECHQYTRIMSLKCKPHVSIVNLGNGQYQHIPTGEIREHQSSGSTKAHSMQSFMRAMDRLQGVILANVDDTQKSHYMFITLTYDHIMSDVSRLKTDWASFWDKLCYYLKTKMGFAENELPKYICVKEPQGNGSFHFHVILIWPCQAPYLDNESVIAKYWGHGFTKTTGVNCPAIHLANYLTNMAKHMRIKDCPVSQQNDKEYDCEEVSVIDESTGFSVREERVRNSRIALYPKSMRIFDTSRGLRSPRVEVVENGDLNSELAKAGEVIEERHYAVFDDDTSLSEDISEEETIKLSKQTVSRYICRKRRKIHDPEYAKKQKEYQESKMKRKNNDINPTVQIETKNMRNSRSEHIWSLNRLSCCIPDSENRARYIADQICSRISSEQYPTILSLYLQCPEIGKEEGTIELLYFELQKIAKSVSFTAAN